ncbi:MAG: hypothetical protein KC635_28465, partial [Myxococcales bacterium]|nr:hypothetical protein [Myxococcales bacterium]
DDLAALLAAGHAHATVAIHLDEDRRTILGYVMDASDATAPVSEADALAAASGALDYPNPARIAPEVASLLLFSARGGDFGGVAVVGAFTGSVFLAFDIVWTGNGQVTYPAAWRSAEELGGGCAPGTLELGDVRRVPLDLGVGFFEEHVPVVLATVFSTALASAVTAGGMRVDETVVIQVPRYPTSGDTSAHQWVVVLSLSPAPE